MNVRRILFIGLILIMLTGAYTAWYVFSPLPVKQTADVYIPSGSSVTKSVSLVQQQHIINHPTLFKLLLRVYCTITGKNVYAGTYRFTSEHSHAHVLRALVSGKQALTVKVTFPEGITAAKFASILKKEIGTDSTEFMAYIHSDSLKQTLNITSPSLEGYLMPNTYEFFWKQPEKDIVLFLIGEQQKIWETRFEQECRTKGKTRNEILTLASIVEAETPQPTERARVAGIYTNRLNRGMKLDADPTVQYALGESRRLLYNDLTINSPYNTYMNIGLPPGPINNPSPSSIDAALHPEQNNYIYFCAKGDGSNTHSFAVTATEHQVNVMRYRKNRRNQD